MPTGKGGGQEREWYRGIPVPPTGTYNWTRRHNTNYMETGVLSALQLTSMFPNLVIENFYVKTRNSMNAGVDAPPHAYVIPVQRDMTKPAELVRILRVQGETLVHSVEEGSPAAACGIRSKDVILKLNGVNAGEARMFTLRRLLCAEGKEVHVTLRRGTEQVEVKAVLRNWR